MPSSRFCWWGCDQNRFANTYTVINTADSGVGSLSNAIDTANSTLGTDAIVFNIPGTGQNIITITSTDLPTLTET